MWQTAYEWKEENYTKRIKFKESRNYKKLQQARNQSLFNY